MVQIQHPITPADRAKSRLKAAILSAAESAGEKNSDGSVNVILNYSKLHSAWHQDIRVNITTALYDTYGAKLLDSNLDYGRKMLIQVPKDRVNDFANDFAMRTTVQERF